MISSTASTPAHMLGGVRRRTPVDELKWWDLQPGDRVRHFEYGAGTVGGSGPIWIYVTWDNPDEPFSHHTAAIARYLTRCRGVPKDRPRSM